MGQTIITVPYIENGKETISSSNKTFSTETQATSQTHHDSNLITPQKAPPPACPMHASKSPSKPLTDAQLRESYKSVLAGECPITSEKDDINPTNMVILASRNFKLELIII
jgi:hypothetical protein